MKKIVFVFYTLAILGLGLGLGQLINEPASASSNILSSKHLLVKLNSPTEVTVHAADPIGNKTKLVVSGDRFNKTVKCVPQ